MLLQVTIFKHVMVYTRTEWVSHSSPDLGENSKWKLEYKKAWAKKCCLKKVRSIAQPRTACKKSLQKKTSTFDIQAETFTLWNCLLRSNLNPNCDIWANKCEGETYVSECSEGELVLKQRTSISCKGEIHLSLYSQEENGPTTGRTARQHGNLSKLNVEQGSQINDIKLIESQIDFEWKIYRF